MSASSYQQIFKSTAIVGGAQVVTIAVGIVRTKLLAVLLGPFGVGAVGLYSTAMQMIGTLTGLGIGSSGVREVADAVGTGDEMRVARTVATLRRVALFCGIVGMLVFLALSAPLSLLSFGDGRHTAGMALLSLTLLLGSLTDGQQALLRGLRRIRELVLTQVLGTLFGAVASLVLVYLLREQGVAPYLLAVSGFTTLVSWWFARRVRCRPVTITLRETLREAGALLGMGTAFMVSGLLASGVAFLSRIVISQRLGTDAVGLYQATWTLSSLYVGLVLNAMGMDYFPRLTAAARDNGAVNRMVNEQTEMGLLIALPGVLATIAFAPLILNLFYTSEFVAASGVIRWQIVGTALRVASWPLGYVQLAKGRAGLFIATETAAHSAHLLLTVAGLHLFGLDGVGIAFAVLYGVYTLGMLWVCRFLSGFRWSRAAGTILLASCAAVAASFAAIEVLPQNVGTGVSVVIMVVAGGLCLAGVQARLGSGLLSILAGKIKGRRGAADSAPEGERSPGTGPQR